jgi:hypothetical protein
MVTLDAKLDALLWLGNCCSLALKQFPELSPAVCEQPLIHKCFNFTKLEVTQLKENVVEKGHESAQVF